MSEKKIKYDMEAIRNLLDLSDLSQPEVMMAIKRGIFRAEASCDYNCEKCSGGCITCSPGKSNPSAA